MVLFIYNALLPIFYRSHLTVVNLQYFFCYVCKRQCILKYLQKTMLII
nr:MAG TPA: hypothetical protein [Caudoviricetes sp.]